jgi:FSR family fosmidomycin resistance protein-like MFS transporter
MPETTPPEASIDASGAEPVGAETEELSRRLLYGLSLGHAVKHFGQGAVLILVPEVKATLALSDVAVGAMFGARDAASGVANVPAGLLTDMYRHRVPLLLMISMALVGAAYLMIGLSSWYWLTLVALIVIGAGTSLWHAPAFSELAVRYPQRVGFAMAAHSTGAQIGNTTAPVLVGLLLGGIGVLGIEWAGLGWRTIALLLVIPAIMTAAVIAVRFRAGPPSATAISLADYLGATGRLLRNPAVLAQALLHALRGAAHNSIQLFLVIYMAEELDYSDFSVGLHVSLLTLAGIASTPVLGVASDRFGRRLVSTLSMAAISLFVLAFLWADDGWALTLNTVLLGVFLFSIMPVIVASAMDATAIGSEGTSVAALFAGGALIGAGAPPIAGAINAGAGFEGVVLFVAGLAMAGTLLSWFAPRGPARSA